MVDVKTLKMERMRFINIAKENDNWIIKEERIQIYE